MVAATFDTLKFANTLKAAGVPDKQAEAQAVAFADIIQLNLKDLITKEDADRTAKTLKADLDQLEKTLRAEFDRFTKEIRKELQELREEFQREIKQLREEIQREIKDLGNVLRTEIKDLNTKVDLQNAKLTGDLFHQRWVLGALLALVLGIFARLFFYPVH